jgi:hypothetical protein
MKEFKVTEISIWWKNFNKALNREEEPIIGLQLNKLTTDAILRVHFFYNEIYRLNVSVYPISKKDLFENLDLSCMSTTYRRGDDIASMLAFLDLELVLSLNNETERLRYLLNWIQPRVKDFFDFYNIDVSNLILGFKEIEENDFYVRASRKFLNKKGDIEIWLEKRVHSTEEIYRLSICTIETNNKIFLNIASKALDYFGKEMTLEETLNLTKYFTIDGWKKGNIFHFQWGEEEKYEFHGDRMQLFKNGELVS